MPEKFPVFNVEHDALKMIAQQLLGARAELRNAASALVALIPLTHKSPRDQDWNRQMKQMRQQAESLADKVEQLYNEIALAAFSELPPQGPVLVQHED